MRLGPFEISRPRPAAPAPAPAPAPEPPKPELIAQCPCCEGTVLMRVDTMVEGVVGGDDRVIGKTYGCLDCGLSFGQLANGRTHRIGRMRHLLEAYVERHKTEEEEARKKRTSEPPRSLAPPDQAWGRRPV